MNESHSYYGAKYMGDDEVLLDEGYVDGITTNDLDLFTPVKPRDMFQIEVGSGAEPNDLCKWIKFAGPEAFDPVDFSEGSKRLDYFEAASDFASQYGEITRAAVLTQRSQLWHFVALPCEGELVTLLMDAEEHYVPEARYKSDRTLIEFGYHSEGPGPISWDASAAIHQIGDHWVYAYGGDNRPESDKLIKAPNDFGPAIVEWLVANRALTAFILDVTTCEWENAALSENLEETWAELFETIGIVHHLTGDEMAEVIRAIENSSNRGKELINLLRSPTHELAEALVALLKETFDRESAHELLIGEGFTDHLKSRKV